MVPEPGEYVGPYEILGQLGTGGMGIVFRAWDERLHREVALKLLNTHYDTPNLRERFLIEARAASGLNHPNICTIFDMGDQDGEPYLVMELLTGQTLKDKIARGAVATPDIVRTSIEIADALAWAHSKGVVHRDIKPANIFLLSRPGGSSQAKVLDFGLAKVSASSRSGRASRALELTSAGTTVGTLAYMSPEQARGEAIDARSDLFSVGVIMYEMCTRRVPFQGATSAMVFTALLSQDPESIRTWNDAVPRDLERVIYRLLAKSRNERFQTAHELHEALHRLTLKGDGDWLRKLPRPSVPLVISADPVARAPRGYKGDHGDGHVSAAEKEIPAPPIMEDDSDPEHHLLRPRRLPRRESGPRESAFGSARETVPELRDPTRVSENVTRVRVHTENGAVLPSGRVLHAEPRREEPQPMADGASMDDVSYEGQEGEPTAAVFERVGSRALRQSSVAAVPVVTETPREQNDISVALAKGSPADKEMSARGPRGRRRMLWVASGVAFLLLAGCLLAYNISRGSLTQVVLHQGDAVLLVPFQNKTGEIDLERAIAQGLEIELAENSRLHFDGLAAYRAGLRQVMQQTHAAEPSVRPQAIAQKIGARAYLYGELRRSGTAYTLSLTVVEAASNDRMAVLSATSPNRDGLPAAITEISVTLRRRLGEGESGDIRHLTPLASQGTGNMTALQSYADGGIASEEGRRSAAVRDYQQATSLAPGFTLAQVRLAWLLEAEGAEVEAAEAAQAAQQYSRHAGDRVAAMAQYTRQALADRDLYAATMTARSMTAARPEDLESLMALTRVMRLGGHLTEALLSAEQAVLRGTFNGAAYDEQARALVGLGRYPEAIKLREDAARLGVTCDCVHVATGYLSRGEVPHDLPKQEETEEPAAAVQRALALDTAGRMTAGLRAWKSAATAAQSSEGLGSAAGGALAQAALNRALLGRCTETRTLIGEASNLLHGQRATLRMGIAGALCEDAPDKTEGGLARNASLHSQVVELYQPMLDAAEALRNREPLRALSALSTLRSQRDLPPLVLYLRGTARLASRQNDLAAEDFMGIEAHRGRAFLSGVAVYGPALASLTRAQLELRDQTAATRTRTELHALYAGADRDILSSSPEETSTGRARGRR